MASPTVDVREDVATLYRDGVVGRKGAFSREWVEQLREDMMTAFREAIRRRGGAVGRGPRRWYIELHPEAISGFVDLVTHPWVVKVCEEVLGPEYEIVEIGFDTPCQGAKDFGLAVGPIELQARVIQIHAEFRRGGETVRTGFGSRRDAMDGKLPAKERELAGSV
jgi:hypothetical protein